MVVRTVEGHLVAAVDNGYVNSCPLTTISYHPLPNDPKNPADKVVRTPVLVLVSMACLR